MILRDGSIEHMGYEDRQVQAFSLQHLFLVNTPLQQTFLVKVLEVWKYYLLPPSVTEPRSEIPAFRNKHCPSSSLYDLRSCFLEFYT